MGKLSIIDRRLLDEVSGKAKAAARKRMNYNLHTSEKEPCNRLLNAMEPGTYFVPHFHGDAEKDETMVMLRGRMGMVVFDEKGNVVETALLDAAGDISGVTIPHGVFHSMVVLDPGTVVLEAKAGPYRPLHPQEIAGWAPAPDSPGAPKYLAKLAQLFANVRKSHGEGRQ